MLSFYINISWWILLKIKLEQISLLNLNFLLHYNWFYLCCRLHGFNYFQIFLWLQFCFLGSLRFLKHAPGFALLSFSCSTIFFSFLTMTRYLSSLCFISVFALTEQQNTLTHFFLFVDDNSIWFSRLNWEIHLILKVSKDASLSRTVSMHMPLICIDKM